MHAVTGFLWSGSRAPKIAVFGEEPFEVDWEEIRALCRGSLPAGAATARRPARAVPETLTVRREWAGTPAAS